MRGRWLIMVMLLCGGSLIGGCSGGESARPSDGGVDAGSDTAPIAPGKEYVEPTAILDDGGHVVARGWARRPLFVFDRAKVPASRASRIREWDYYTIHTPELAIAITLAKLHFDELGDVVKASVLFHDYRSGTKKLGDIQLFGGTLSLQANPGGNYEVTDAGKRLAYGTEGGKRVIEFAYGDPTSPDYVGGRIVIDAPVGDTIALVTPFADDGFFFYENKALSMPATGNITVGSTRHDLPATALAVMDWVRGVMPTSMHWTWSVAMGTVGGKRVGVNLGSVFGEESGGTPNSIFVDGKLHKLDRVDDWTYDLMKPAVPWRIAARDGRVDFTVPPDYFETDDTDLGFYKNMLRKPYGTCKGTARLDDGTTLTLDGVMCAAEVVETTW